jgi:hypothetical protein
LDSGLKNESVFHRVHQAMPKQLEIPTEIKLCLMGMGSSRPN